MDEKRIWLRWRQIDSLSFKLIIFALNMLFAPTGTFQEHSISNGWSNEYLALAEKFDKIYDALK